MAWKVKWIHKYKSIINSEQNFCGQSIVSKLLNGTTFPTHVNYLKRFRTPFAVWKLCTNANLFICLFHFGKYYATLIWQFFSFNNKSAVWIIYRFTKRTMKQTKEQHLQMRTKWQQTNFQFNWIDVMDIVDRSRGFQAILCSNTEFKNNTKTVNGVEMFHLYYLFTLLISAVWGKRQMRKKPTANFI